MTQLKTIVLSIIVTVRSQILSQLTAKMTYGLDWNHYPLQIQKS